MGKKGADAPPSSLKLSKSMFKIKNKKDFQTTSGISYNEEKGRKKGDAWAKKERQVVFY
ncbi:hypothetical protein GT2_21_00380 [Parageobacillus thermoglucosidasius NBRC 107763]|nr:hypothetical protein B4168_1324 [Anoxybacillus flavithermus]OAO83643.1 hypothetical protein GT23_4137 [Parageobacillus thermoglucosidasius]GAJ44743.1 hypothetical protein GT2_21_00380 [Parageobacillus thermoglucosidasius NBRC 107763]